MTVVGDVRGMDGSVSRPVGVALIGLHSLMISIGLVLIVGMLSAAAAFVDGVTIAVPLVFAVQGFTDDGGSPAVTMTGSWVAAVVLILAMATVLTLVIIRVAQRVESRRSAP